LISGHSEGRPDQKTGAAWPWVLRQHAFFLVFVLLYGLAFLVEAYVLDSGRIDWRAFASYSTIYMYGAVLFLFVCLYVLYVMILVRPEHLTAYCLNGIRTKILTKERILMALPIIIFLPIFLSTFTQIKTLIPLANPFSWDPLFMEWDFVLHGGRHPWLWLQPVLGHPLVTKGIYWLYIAWLLVLQAVVFWQTLSVARPLLRMQFFLTFILSWALLGSLGGTLLSSTGPVFYGEVTGLPSPYVPLLDYLRSLNQTGDFSLIEVQDWLWQVYQGGDVAEFSGISAMPSMHVAMVTIFALLGWRVHWAIGTVLTLFAMIILVGSVHLAWHYAVDGYAGIIGACLIWALVGAVLRRHSAFAEDPDRLRGDPGKVLEARTYTNLR
jgi:hypothetical protein